MDERSRAVLVSALALPEADRARIAEELLATLTPEGAETEDDELADELSRRLDEALRDPSASVPWSEIRDRP